MRLLFRSLAVLSFAMCLSARDTLTGDELKLLQDPGGWEYISVSDSDNGIQTQHTCFDGHPHPGQCSGTLTFTAAQKFVQKMRIHGQTVRRHGSYQLDDDQLAFFDELGTRDGPYTLRLDAPNKRLVLEMPQVRIELELEKQYREDMRTHKPANAKPAM